MSKKATKAELIQLFREVFVCREDAYAVGYPRTDGSGKFYYNTAKGADGQNLPLTDEVVWDHLTSKHFIGVYPLLPDNTTGWVAFDFDGGADPIADAFRQKEKLLSAGILSYVERSRSGGGAHVWVFFDRPVSALKARRVMKSLAVDADSFDRFFPNQDSVSAGKIGNLIALPYHGDTYKQESNGCFINVEGLALHPLEVLGNLRRNPVPVIDKLFDSLPAETKSALPMKHRDLPTLKLPGALKMCEFCNWFKQAKARMPEQNQEESLYAMACQLVQLDGGKQILDGVAKLHPYEQSRVDQKWKQAEEVNLPQTCETLWEKFGDCGKRCKSLGVRHPYELARVSFSKLLKGDRASPEDMQTISLRVLDKVEKVARGEVETGIPFGWDALDDHTELRGGDLYIIAALPHTGKTACIIDLAVNLGDRDVPSYIASLEMTNDRLGVRVAARRTGIEATPLERAFMDEKQWKRFTNTQKSEFPIYIDDKAMGLEQVMDFWGEMVNKYGWGVGMIDYIQLMAPEDGERERESISRNVFGLKAIAKFLGIPIIALSQLGRMAEQDMREGEDPLDSWLAGSAGIERTADVIIYMMGKRSNQPVVNRKFRIQKERNRGSAGTELMAKLHQGIFKFEFTGPGGTESLDEL